MTLQESEKRRRTRYQDDDEFEFRPRKERKKHEPPRTKFIFRVNGKPKPPAEIHTRSFKLGDVVSTSEGPHKVVEIYWSGSDKRGWKAQVLLRPLKTADPKDIKDDRKQPRRDQKGPQKPRKDRKNYQRYQKKGPQAPRSPKPSANPRGTRNKGSK